MKHRLPIATLINTLTVLVGGAVGLSLSHVFSAEIKDIVFQALGLGTFLIGIKMSLKVPDGYMLSIIFSLILGGIVGELLGVDVILEGLGGKLQSMVGIHSGGFTEGLITAFLLFCVGSMTIIGSIEEGLTGNRELLLIKSTLDGFAATALAASYGVGVLFSALPLLLFQGSIFYLARVLKPFFDDTLLDVITSVGGLLILGISINMLQLGKINLENLLPALLMSVVIYKVQQLWVTNNDKR